MENQTCGNCLYWDLDKNKRNWENEHHRCKMMSGCLCCSHDPKQLGGAIGGSHFESFKNFGCNMWRIDSRNKNEKT